MRVPSLSPEAPTPRHQGAQEDPTARGLSLEQRWPLADLGALFPISRELVSG